MFTKELFDKAMLFYGTKIYNKFFSGQIICLRLSDGTDAYLSVMGSISDYISLAVYPGEEGLHCLLMLTKGFQGEDSLLTGMFQHSLQCVFQPKSEMPDHSIRAVKGLLDELNIQATDKSVLPAVIRYEPFRLDCPGSEDDYRMIEEAFDAVLYLARQDEKGQLSISSLPLLDPDSKSHMPCMVKDGDGYRLSTIETEPFDESMLPEAELPAEDLMQQAASLRKYTSEDMEVSLSLVAALDDKDGTGRAVICTLLSMNHRTGKILDLKVGKEEGWSVRDQLEAFVKLMLKRKKKPVTIFTNSVYTFHLLKPLCDRLGISLVFNENLRNLSHAVLGLHQYLHSGGGFSRKDLS